MGVVHVSGYQVGNVVRYLGTEPKAWLTRGGLAKVIQVSKKGRLRLAGKGGAPQYIESDECELVSATDEHGIFDRRPRGSGHSFPAQAVTELPQPEPAQDPQPDPEPAQPDPWEPVRAIWPTYEDGAPVMLDDWVEMGGEPVQVVEFDIDANNALICGYGSNLAIKPGEHAQRSEPDSIERIMADVREVVTADAEMTDWLEWIVRRAAKVGGAS